MNKAIAIMIMAMMIVGCGNEAKTENENEEVDLWITAWDFETLFNQKAAARNVPQLQLNIEFGTGDAKYTFGHKFQNTFYLMGEINPETRKIKTVSIIKNLITKNKQAEMQASAVAFLIMVQALSPDLDSSERAEILEKFLESNKRYTSVIKDDVKYSQTFIDGGKTLMLSATGVKK